MKLRWVEGKRICFPPLLPPRMTTTLKGPVQHSPSPPGFRSHTPGSRVSLDLNPASAIYLPDDLGQGSAHSSEPQSPPRTKGS